MTLPIGVETLDRELSGGCRQERSSRCSRRQASSATRFRLPALESERHTSTDDGKRGGRPADVRALGQQNKRNHYLEIPKATGVVLGSDDRSLELDIDQTRNS